jgi:very-short-patch-repair endonuclease
MAAVLTCGPDARLSHRSAAKLWGFQLRHSPLIDIAIPSRIARRGRRGIRVHRQAHLDENQRVVDRIPVTDPVSTLVDLASCLSRDQLERAVNEADRLDLVDPEGLRETVETLQSRPGTGRLRTLLDHYTRTDTGLERKFLGLVRGTGLPTPDTQVWLHGYRVDFYWPDLDLIVETDGLHYHRTTFQQADDHRRDQIHTAAGLTTVRFAESQITDEADHVRAVLADMAGRLRRRA